jgi:hypothetical protein
MITLQLIFFILAIIFFGLAPLGVPSPARFNFLAGGLFFLALGIVNIKVN